MTVFLTLPEKNNTPILSEYGTREANLTNVVAGAAGIDYPKSMTINSGSWTTQATILVYDDILRFDKGTLTNTTPITKDNFKFSTFQTNIFWWVDNLIGMESDWRKNASPGIVGNTAYGYGQFTEASVITALNRYTEHIKRYNKRHTIQIKVPEWVTNGKRRIADNNYHTDIMDELSYDQVSALIIIHAHSKLTNDFDWVKLQRADVLAAKRIYSAGHHTDPDAKTKARMDSFWIDKHQTAKDLIIKQYK
jgi:hypothetical protein